MSGPADPQIVDAATIRQRVGEVRQRIEAAAAGRPGRVTLVAVTKSFPAVLVDRALEAGLVDLGENYAQELVGKAEALAAGPAGPGGAGPRWHFIGGLQTNKVKLLAGLVHLWQTVDRPGLVDAIAKRDPGARILVQVNTTGEAQKSGCEPEEAPALVDRARQAGLDVRGLMTIGPTSSDVDPRPAFVLLRQLGERCEVVELSMGMSSDYELAVAEGSTMVRIGSALFGARPAPGARGNHRS